MLPDQSHEILPGEDTDMQKVILTRSLLFLLLAIIIVLTVLTISVEVRYSY